MGVRSTWTPPAARAQGRGWRPGAACRAAASGEQAADGKPLHVDGQALTGAFGADVEWWNRVLAGVAFSLSEANGTFDLPGMDSGRMASRLTSPYVRLQLTDRLSWGLVGWGMGNLTITHDARAATAAPPAVAERVTNTDIGPDALICTAGIDSDVSTKELLILDWEDSYMSGGDEEPYPHPGRRIDRPAAPQEAGEEPWPLQRSILPRDAGLV